jgi:hypothetical protein
VDRSGHYDPRIDGKAIQPTQTSRWRAFAYVSNKKTNGHSQSTQAAQTLGLLRSQETYEDLEKLREARARQW